MASSATCPEHRGGATAYSHTAMSTALLAPRVRAELPLLSHSLPCFARPRASKRNRQAQHGRAQVTLTETLTVDAPNPLEARFLYEDTAGYLDNSLTLLRPGDTVVDVGALLSQAQLRSMRKGVGQ